MARKTFRNYFYFLVFTMLALTYSSCKEDLGNLTLNPSPQQQQPSIAAMTPDKVFRGETDVEGRITGQNLSSTTSVNLGAGTSVSNLKVIDANHITFLFSVNRSASDGPRDVTVVTANGQVTARVLTIGSQQVPFARFGIHGDDNWKGSEFRFDASASSGDAKIKQYHWDFGDGNKAGGVLVTHRYNRAGNFDVTLDVVDNRGAVGSTTKSVRIQNNYAPIARFTMDGIRVIGKPIQFDASQSDDRDNANLTYRWSFGDGASAEGKRVTHTFDSSRTFGVRLTVKDNKGASDTLERDLEIKKPYEPPPKPDPGPGPVPGDGTTCKHNVYFQNWFTVRAVNGNVVTVSVQPLNCSGHGEVRRQASGIAEFVGDVTNISGYNITLNYASLPLSTRPQVGESLYILWKP